MTDPNETARQAMRAIVRALPDNDDAPDGEATCIAVTLLLLGEETPRGAAELVRLAVQDYLRELAPATGTMARWNQVARPMYEALAADAATGMDLVERGERAVREGRA